MTLRHCAIYSTFGDNNSADVLCVSLMVHVATGSQILHGAGSV